MDTLRGPFDTSDIYDDAVEFDAADDDSANDLPPSPIGQDERRMQVRAYNHWASLLGDADFPSIEDLEPASIDDFGPFSVLLDFSKGIEDPSIQFLGAELANECGADGPIEKFSDVPSRSLLSRITDHYMQILANQAPIGFEAEFINDNGITILYRGILLPFSSDGETIDFIYGVINWKEMADRLTADELLLEIDHALEGGAPPAAEPEEAESTPLELTDGWADGPSEAAEHFDAEESEEAPAEVTDDDLPVPDFGHFALGDDEEDEEEEANYDFASLTDHVAPPKPKADALDLDGLEAEAPAAEPLDMAEFEIAEDLFAHEEREAEEAAWDESSSILNLSDAIDAIDLGDSGDLGENPEPVAAREPAPVEESLASETIAADDAVIADGLEPLAESADLHDCLASARELAHTASTCEDRSRVALYAAVGRAYDVSLAAEEAPADYAEILEESGLTAQDRAPMTPIVKLVFGADYDKTRVTEYATVLSHAHRVGIERGSLAKFLSDAEGGLKSVVQAERRARKEEKGEEVAPVDQVREALAKKLRALEPQELDTLSADGPEFALVMVRRTEDGDVVMLGELDQDIPLVERAARKLLK